MLGEGGIEEKEGYGGEPDRVDDKPGDKLTCSYE